jgi:hypothetical protein
MHSTGRVGLAPFSQEGRTTQVMDGLIFALGLALVLLTGLSILFTLVLPRRPIGPERLSLVINRVVRVMVLAVSRFFKTYESKDAVLAATGPFALVAQLAVWLGLFVVGYSMMLEPHTHRLSNAFAQGAVSIFTVGTGSAGGSRDLSVDIAAGATWAVVVAIQIAYLPALYSAFSEREGLVAMLESRAGVPAWGPEVLARHQLVGIIDTLPDFYADWEKWSADLAESHTTYPVLLLFRSPDPWYSWLIGLLAVLDGAAMHLALAPESASSEARLCIRMGFTALQRIAVTLGWRVDPDPDPEGPLQLTFEEFESAVGMLADYGFPMERSAKDAWSDFRGWRVNYESIAYRLADRITAPPAPWSGSRSHLRTGTVAPRRPPQRRPGELSLIERRPEVTITAPPRRSGSSR